MSSRGNCHCVLSPGHSSSHGDLAESGYLGYLQPHLTHSPETGPSILGQITSSMSSDALSAVG